MKDMFFFIFCAAAVAATAVFGYRGQALWCCVSAAVALLALLIIWRSLALQLRTIRTGMDLLRCRDFASRLRHVGVPQADTMVDLYNSLMDNMKNERLRASEQHHFLSKLIEASPMGVAVCSFDAEVETTNEAFRELATPEVVEALRSLDADGSVTVRSGTQVLRCSRNYFMDRGFRRPFFLVERLTDEIVRAETDVFHKMVRTVSHEVNNTLGGVISVLESLAELHAADKDVAEVIAGCTDSCSRLGDFVRSYADVAKLPEPQLKELDLAAFVAGSMPFLRSLCPAGIDIESDCSADAATVQADPTLLPRVVVNAVKNAAESIGRRGGKIVIGIRGRSLMITDNGPGLSDEAAENIFKPFFSTKKPDRGLGLMLIAEILRRHKAGFSLSTQNSLTTLRVTFPRQ